MAMQAWVETIRRNKKVVGYRVRFSDAAGVRRSEPGVFEKKGDAVALKDAVQDRLFNGRIGRVDPTLLMAALADKWLIECRAGLANKKGKKLSPNTITTYKYNVRPFVVHFVKLMLVNEESLNEWRLEMEELELAEWTIADRLKDVKNFMGWCYRRKYTKFDARDSIAVSRPIALPRYYTDAEIEAIEQAAAGDPLHLAIRLGYKAGLRRGEVLRADKRDIRWMPNGWGELMVWADESKNGEYRTVPLPPAVMELVGTRGEGLLFPGMTRDAFDYHWIRIKVKSGIEDRTNWLHKTHKWAEEANVSEAHDQARFHDLRHTFCRIFIESGAGDLHKLSKITGHKSLDVLRRVYGHFDTRLLHEAMAHVEARPKFVGVRWEKNTEIIGPSEDMIDQAGTSEDRSKKVEGGEK